MKLQTLLILFLAPFVAADLPKDLVPEDALAVVSIENGSFESGFQQVMQAVGERENIITELLSRFVEDHASVDTSQDILLILQPTELAEGQRPTGMFGPMPHVIFICKPKEGQQIQMKPFGPLKSSTMYEGWFVGSGSDRWLPPISGDAPILQLLPEGQVRAAIQFGTFWSKFGPIVQMTGGMAVGGMSKPGPGGVIDPKTKAQAIAANKAFRELMLWCAKVDVISSSADIEDSNLTFDLDIAMKDGMSIEGSNAAMIGMASLLTDDMIQYAMTGEVTRLLMEMEPASSGGLGSSYGLPPLPVTQLSPLAELTNDNVVAYGLNVKNGLTISSLAEVDNQRKYLSKIPDLMDSLADYFKSYFAMQLKKARSSKTTWDMKMVGPSTADTKVMEAVFPSGDQWSFQKRGSDRISFSIGPKKWKPFAQSHSTPLSVLIDRHDDVAVDFAMCVDARNILFNFLEVAHSAGTTGLNDRISASPAAKVSLMVGRNETSIVSELKLDLVGLITLGIESGMQ
jgi:hypothetical protein